MWKEHFMCCKVVGHCCCDMGIGNALVYIGFLKNILYMSNPCPVEPRNTLFEKHSTIQASELFSCSTEHEIYPVHKC